MKENEAINPKVESEYALEHILKDNAILIGTKMDDPEPNLFEFTLIIHGQDIQKVLKVKPELILSDLRFILNDYVKAPNFQFLYQGGTI